jgi:hypothetical protein
MTCTRIMRSLTLAVATAAAALALAVGASASPVQPLHGGTCQVISATQTVCFEAWGVFKPRQSGGYIDLFQRRFTEYTSGVVTYRQSDHVHFIVILDASGAEHVSLLFFSGWSTSTGLRCRFREHLVVIKGTVVDSVDQTVCA